MNVRKYTKDNIKKLKGTTITDQQAKNIADQWANYVDNKQGTMPNWRQCNTVQDLMLVAHFLSLDGSGVLVTESYKFSQIYDALSAELGPNDRAVGQVIGAYCLFRISYGPAQTLH